MNIRRNIFSTKGSKVLFVSIILVICSFVNENVMAYASTIISDPVERIYAKMRIDSLQTVVKNSVTQFRYEDAILAGEKILKETISLYGEVSSECGFAYSNLATLYSSNRDYQNAVKNATISLDIINKEKGKNNIDYAIVLDNISKYYNELEEYEKGYNTSLIATELFKDLCSENSIDYSIALGNLANNAYGLGKVDEAISCAEKCLRIIETLQGKDNESYATFLDNIANYYYNKGYKERAIISNLEAYNIWKNKVNDSSWDWAICNGNLGMHYFDMEEYEAALPFLKEAKNCYERLGATELPIYESFLLELLITYQQQEQINDAIEVCELLLAHNEIKNPEKAYTTEIALLQLLSQHGNSDRLQYLTSTFENRHSKRFKDRGSHIMGLMLLSSIHEAINDTTKVTECNKKIDKLLVKIKDKSTLFDIYCNLFDKAFSSKDIHSANRWGTKIMAYKDIDNSLFSQKLTTERAKNICSISDWLEHYNEAVKYGNVWISICKDVNSMNDYVDALMHCATYNSHLGKYAQAIHLGERCLSVLDSIPNGISEISERKSAILNNLGKYHIQLGEYERAMMHFNAALELKDTYTDGYAITLGNIASCYSDISDYQMAIQLQEEARAIIENSGDVNTIAYSTLLMNLGNDYCKIGDYTSALECLNMAYQSQCDYLGETHTSSLLTLANIGVLYGEIGDYKTAAMCEGKALEQMKQSWSEDNIYYIMGLSNFASIVRHIDLDGAENKSIDIEQKALDLKRQYLGQKHPTVITSLFNIAQYYVLGGRYDLSLPYYYDAIDLHKELYGSFNLDFLELMSEVWYVKLNNNVELNDSDTTNILFFCNNLMPILKRQFGNMRADLRNYYWTNASSLLDLTYLMCEEKKVEENIGKICAESAYNYALIRKGLLVNSVRNVNEILKDDSNEIRNIKQDLDSMYAAYRNLVMRDITETSQTTQSLKNSIRLLENNLIKISNERGDFSGQMNMNYNSIKNVLKDGEIAIEFVKYKGLHDVIKYAALIITSDMTCPKFVPLFEAVELERLNPNQYYSDLNISHLIWEPLKEYLDDKTTIFFSPDGELHNIAIEYVPFIKKSASLFDLFQVFRLTSTRELLNRDSIPPKNSATLFGDMDFNATVEFDDNSATTLSSAQMNRGLKNELMKRAGFTRLLATKVEVDSIQKIINPYVSRIHTYMGASATEGAFKNLSDTECAILHIATHGVYWDKEAFDKADLKFGCESGISSTPLTYVEDKAMTRSALLFSGANNTVKNGSTNSFDDGILSAYEISQLDLTKLDLAILSACQTGLGDISGDGVFGLQRGFKIAGTKSLLMSLWEVDDEATSLLMIEFYRNYLNGYSKRESLLGAQKTVRETPGFEDPEYWAAFILLDALN